MFEFLRFLFNFVEIFQKKFQCKGWRGFEMYNQTVILSHETRFIS